MKVLKVALVCLFFLKLHFVLALEDSGELFFQKPKTSVSNVPLIKSVSPKNKLFYNAKKHNFDVEKKKIFMSGDVLLQYEGNQVKAQKADIDLNQKIMELSGNVDMNFEDGTSIQAQRVLYYYEKGEAKIFNGRVKSGADIFKAQVIQRNADSSFGVKKGYWTYCDHDFQKNPDWKVWCSSVIPVTSKYGLVYNPIFYVKKLPVFWLPVMLLPLNKQRQSGVLFPKFSFNELNGFTMLNQLYLALSPHQDATLGYTYFGNRGHKASLEYRFLPLEGLSGLLHGYYIDDEIFKNSYGKKDRLAFDYHHLWSFSDVFQSTAVMKWVSDDQYIEDFDDEFMEANLASALESNLSFSWNTPFGNVTAQGSTYQDLLSVDPLSPDNHIVHQVPQLSGSFFPVILFEDFPLLAAVDISYLHLTNFSSFSGSLSDNVNSHYFELSPRFSLPLDIGVTQFMPQFGLREALLNNSVSEQLKSSLSADVGFELSVNMQKIFQTQWGGALSHFMEPKMKYSFNSWLYNEPDFLEQFRPVPSQHEFSFLIDNDVYQKQYRVNQENFILVDTKYVKVFEFDITQPLNMAVIAAGGLNIFNDLTSHMNLSVSPFNFGTELSMNTNQMALKQLTVTSSFGYAFPFLGAGANMKMNAMNFSLDEFGANIETSDPWSNSYAAAYKKTKDKSGDFDLSFGMGFLAWMTLSAVSTYSLDSGNFLKHSAKLEINPFSRCWKLGVDFGHSLDKGFSVNAAFTLIFGVEQQLPMVGYKSESGVGGIQWFPKNSS